MPRPSLTHALIPQSAIEKLGLVTVMAAGELQLFDVNNEKNDDLLAIIARTRPDCSILCHDNQYSFSTSDLQELIVTNKTISPRVLSCAYGEMLRVNTARRSLLKPSVCRRTLTRRARYLSRYSRKYRPSASSVYYTTDIRSLRDLVLYWLAYCSRAQGRRRHDPYC